MTASDRDTSRRRPLGWFWGLLALAVALAGALSQELAAPPSSATGLAVAVTGTVTVLAVLQATRILRALTADPGRGPAEADEVSRGGGGSSTENLMEPQWFARAFLRRRLGR